MRYITKMLFGVAALSAVPATAATIINTAPTGGSTLTYATLAPGDVLSNNGPFSNGGPGTAGPRDAYIFNEGTASGVQSFLFHYDRAGGADSNGTATGSFQLSLNAGEIFVGVQSTLAGLLATDPANGVTYQAGGSSVAARFRGLEPSDIFTVSQLGSIVTVTYSALQSNGFSLDEARLLVQAAPVPEPAAWALMVGGFGLVGTAMRRRRRSVVFA